MNLVQVDAVVTDHRGRQVTNLKADDFQVLEDHKPRPVPGVNYDMSFESVAFLPKSLAKFVDSQLHAGGQVAILRAGSGSGARDEFTSNRRVLQEEAGLIPWVPALWGSPFFGYPKPPVYLAASTRTRPGLFAPTQPIFHPTQAEPSLMGETNVSMSSPTRPAACSSASRTISIARSRKYKATSIVTT